MPFPKVFIVDTNCQIDSISDLWSSKKTLYFELSFLDQLASFLSWYWRLDSLTWIFPFILSNHFIFRYAFFFFDFKWPLLTK